MAQNQPQKDSRFTFKPEVDEQEDDLLTNAET